MTQFSHIDNKGKACMVDVGEKPAQKRRAKARGKIFLLKDTIDKIRDNQIKKGDVLTVAQIAGIQAAKQTPHLIPLCHQLSLNKVAVNFEITEDGVIAESEVLCNDRTGVEMEALTAVCVALLTIYDMCKAVDKNMHISNVVLLEKEKT